MEQIAKEIVDKLSREMCDFAIREKGREELVSLLLAFAAQIEARCAMSGISHGR